MEMDEGKRENYLYSKFYDKNDDDIELTNSDLTQVNSSKAIRNDNNINNLKRKRRNPFLQISIDINRVLQYFVGIIYKCNNSFLSNENISLTLILNLIFLICTILSDQKINMDKCRIFFIYYFQTRKLLIHYSSSTKSEIYLLFFFGKEKYYFNSLIDYFRKNNFNIYQKINQIVYTSFIVDIKRLKYFSLNNCEEEDKLVIKYEEPKYLYLYEEIENKKFSDFCNNNDFSEYEQHLDKLIYEY